MDTPMLEEPGQLSPRLGEADLSKVDALAEGEGDIGIARPGYTFGDTYYPVLSLV